MSPLVTNTLLVMVAVFAVLISVEAIRKRQSRQFFVEAACLIVAVGVLRWATGFPEARVAFGGSSQLLAIIIMIVCVALGIAARYIFYLRGRFSWLAFLKPLVVSPIVVLPLLGSVQSTGTLTSLQLVSIAFLSFQNGFFWLTVLEKAKGEVSRA